MGLKAHAHRDTPTATVSLLIVPLPGGSLYKPSQPSTPSLDTCLVLVDGDGPAEVVKTLKPQRMT